jgi:succinoglycan biosynthesis protein ExoM
MSLGEQLVPEHIKPIILVIDNEETPTATAIVECFDKTSPYPAYYVHEPVRGIARARNRALLEALDLMVDWIAFIDDDETAELDWLANLMAPEYLNVPVLRGVNVYTNTTLDSPWFQPKEIKGEEGQLCKTAYTSNVRFSIDLVRQGLRFNESLGLMGGEDNEFFSAAHAKGFAIRRTLRAVTNETWPAERLTYWALVYRAYWCAASEYRRLAASKGHLGVFVRKAHTIPLNLLIGLMWLAGALVVGLVSKEAFRDGAMLGGKKLARGAGRLAAALGIKPQPYRTIHGE